MPQKRLTGFQSCAWVFGFVAMSSLLTACQTPNLSLNRSTPAKLIVAPLREPFEPIPPSQMVEVRGGNEMRFTSDQGTGDAASFKLR